MISAAERQERLEAVESVIGTQRAEGIHLSPAVRSLMDQFVDGELTLDQLSTSLREHGRRSVELAHVA